MMGVMVIAARSSAARYGPGRLVVDGTDETLRRKTTFACHPTAAQADALHGLLGVCCEVYNAALAEPRDAWRSAGLKVSLFDQFGQLTELRGVRVTPPTSVIGAGPAPRQPPPGRLPNSGMTNLFLRRP